MSIKVKFHKGAWWIFIHHHGRRKAKKIGDRATAFDVAGKIRQRFAEGDLGVLQSDPGPTLKTYATKWLSDGEAARKISTHRFYRFNLDLHILPGLGERPVSALKRADCRDLLAACRAKGLKPASMRGVNRTLSVVLSQAVDDELLAANPAFRMGKHLRTGDDLPPEIQPLTCEEAFTFLTTAEEHFPEFHPLFLCALRTGMRLGELLALEWGDIDFAARLIHVRRNRVAGRLTSTKNKQRRHVDMSQALTTTLQRLRTERKRIALQAGTPMPAWVFLTPARFAKEKPVRGFLGVDGDNLRNRIFYRLLEKAGLRQIRFHDLRHTYASLLIQNGESLAYVSRQLGHSSIQVTVDVYGHLIPGANRAAVDRLDARPTRNPGATGVKDEDHEKAVSD